MPIMIDFMEYNRLRDLSGDPVHIVDVSQFISISNEESYWDCSIGISERDFWGSFLSIMLFISFCSVIEELESLTLHDLSKMVKAHERSS